MADPPNHRSYLLVDGHNVMHSWPELKPLQRAKHTRRLAQLQLLQRLRHYQDMSGNQVVVVFDGVHDRTSEEREDGGLQIIFAGTGVTADAIIERLAVKYASRHSLKVASADGLVRDSVLASGADWISPEMLRHLCDEAEAQIRRRIGG